MKSWEHKTEAAKPEGSTSESVVLITGGTRGIGRAIALRLARATPRHIVLAYCLDHQAARNTLEEIKGMGVSASVMVCDVGQEKLQREMFQQVEETWGRLDVFVANAARTAFQSAETLPTRSFRRTMELNAEAFLVGAQLAAAIMKKNGGGRIIALSSLGSRYFIPNYAALGAADGFSGPIIRGDIDTVRNHLKVLQRTPVALEVYRSLARAASDYLPGKKKAELEKILKSPPRILSRNSLRRFPAD